MNVQNRIFQSLGLGPEEVEEKFGFFLRALEFGAPPHGGIALGVDRVVAMILDTNSIRDVIAFPKNRSAYCPLSHAPSPVTRAQLGEVGLLNLSGDKPLPKPEEETLLGFLSWVSRIGIAEGEERQLEQAIAEAERIAKVLADNARPDEEPLFTVNQTANRTRPGSKARIHPLAADGELLRNAPAVKGDYFKVANILE
jgi:aspartyl-tRNA synthetase